jgi:hypothetical protein
MIHDDTPLSLESCTKSGFRHRDTETRRLIKRRQT